jgi:hypothetical protein
VLEQSEEDVHLLPAERTFNLLVLSYVKLKYALSAEGMATRRGDRLVLRLLQTNGADRVICMSLPQRPLLFVLFDAHLVTQLGAYEGLEVSPVIGDECGDSDEGDGEG